MERTLKNNRMIIFFILFFTLINCIFTNIQVVNAEEILDYTVDELILRYKVDESYVYIQIDRPIYEEMMKEKNELYNAIKKQYGSIKTLLYISRFGKTDPKDYKYVYEGELFKVRVEQNVGFKKGLELSNGTPHDELKDNLFSIVLDEAGNPKLDENGKLLMVNVYDKYLEDNGIKPDITKLKEGKNEVNVGEKIIYVYADKDINITEVTDKDDTILIEKEENIGNGKLDTKDVEKIKERISKQNQLTLKSLGKNIDNKIMQLPNNIVPTTILTLNISKEEVEKITENAEKENLKIYLDKKQEKYELEILDRIDNADENIIGYMVLVPLGIEQDIKLKEEKYHFRFGDEKSNVEDITKLKEGKNEVNVGEKIIYVYADKDINITEVTDKDDTILIEKEENIGNGKLDTKDVEKIKERISKQNQLTLKSLGKNIDNKIMQLPNNIVPTTILTLNISKEEVEKITENAEKENLKIYLDKKQEKYELEILERIDNAQKNIIGYMVLVPLEIEQDIKLNEEKYHFRFGDEKSNVEDNDEIGLHLGENHITVGEEKIIVIVSPKRGVINIIKDYDINDENDKNDEIVEIKDVNYFKDKIVTRTGDSENKKLDEDSINEMNEFLKKSKEDSDKNMERFRADLVISDIKISGKSSKTKLEFTDTILTNVKFEGNTEIENINLKEVPTITGISKYEIEKLKFKESSIDDGKVKFKFNNENENKIVYEEFTAEHIEFKDGEHKITVLYVDVEDEKEDFIPIDIIITIEDGKIKAVKDIDEDEISMVPSELFNNLFEYKEKPLILDGKFIDDMKNVIEEQAKTPSEKEVELRNGYSSIFVFNENNKKTNTLKLNRYDGQILYLKERTRLYSFENFEKNFKDSKITNEYGFQLKEEARREIKEYLEKYQKEEFLKDYSKEPVKMSNIALQERMGLLNYKETVIDTGRAFNERKILETYIGIDNQKNSKDFKINLVEIEEILGGWGRKTYDLGDYKIEKTEKENLYHVDIKAKQNWAINNSIKFDFFINKINLKNGENKINIKSGRNRPVQTIYVQANDKGEVTEVRDLNNKKITDNRNFYENYRFLDEKERPLSYKLKKEINAKVKEQSK